VATTINRVSSTQENFFARSKRRRSLLAFHEGKNALLLAMAGAIEAQVASILGANLQDLESSGLEGRDCATDCC